MRTGSLAWACAGLFCCGGFILGSAAPAVLGWIAEKSSLTTGMSSLGVFYFLGAVSVVFACRFQRR